VPGAPALFERESVELARRARAASGGRRRALLASLSGETAPEVEPGGQRR
jgi:hypothetical protein